MAGQPPARAAAAAVAAAAAEAAAEVVSGLAGSERLRGLELELGQVPGGGRPVARLLRAAFRESARAAGGDGGRTSSAGAAPGLAAAVQEAAWEKLHSGSWHEVPAVWRDAYTAACLLAVAEALAAAGPVGGAAAAAAPGPGAALASALRQLDLGALMGGRLLRQEVDALVGCLQEQWWQLHAGQREGGRQGRRELGAAWPAPAAAVALPPGSLGPRGAPVGREELPPLERFWRDHMAGGGGGCDTEGVPLVITGGMQDWPALARWADPRYLLAAAGPRTVPVEVGRHYLAEGWGQRLMTLEDFIRTHLQPGGGGGAGDTAGGGGAGGGSSNAEGGRAVALPPEGSPPAAAAGPEAAGGGGSPPGASAGPPSPPVGYLAQHPLFEQVPRLARDIREPGYCVLGEGEVRSVNAWFGPASTVTPLHSDPHHNLLCQVVGRKYVRLYRPSLAPALYPHPAGMHTNSSRVDLDAPDHAAFPAFGAAPWADVALEPGQMLYIPPGWWHYVKSLSLSFSVSYWWS